MKTLMEQIREQQDEAMAAIMANGYWEEVSGSIYTKIEVTADPAHYPFKTTVRLATPADIKRLGLNYGR